jgi:hypothetical protein
VERKRVTTPFSKYNLLEMHYFRRHGVEDEPE